MNETSYSTSTERFVIYITIRCLQALIGIPGNVCTLIIIYKMKQKANLHIIMVYLAFFDITVSCLVPLTAYVLATEANLIHIDDWDTMCIVKEILLWISYLGCNVSCAFLSVDR